MEDVSYRRALAADIPTIVELRAAFLADVAGSTPNERALLAALTRYFSTTIGNREFIAFVAAAGDRVIATSGLVYHRHPPSATNLEGVEAYVMNMYTTPAFGGRGIASVLLKELVAIARQCNCRPIPFDAFPKAAPIYTRAAFVSIDNEMKLDLR